MTEREKRLSEQLEQIAYQRDNYRIELQACRASKAELAAEITALQNALEEEHSEALRFAFIEKLRQAIYTIQEGIDMMHALIDSDD